LVFLPLDRFKMGQSQEIREVKTEFFLNPNLEIMDPILEAKTLSLNGPIVPGNFSTLNRMEPEAVPGAPERVEEPVKTERIEEKVPLVASADTVVQNTGAELTPAPTYSTILGRITLKHKETLSRIMRQVYGEFNSNYLKLFIITNPEIGNPDQVEVGQIISLPAIPVEVAPGDNRVWWIKVDETDTLEGAINILRKYPESSPGVRLIPYWNPAGGFKFAVVLGELFEDEKSARTQQENLPGELSSGSTIFSRWDKKTVFFTNPYLDRIP